MMKICKLLFACALGSSALLSALPSSIPQYQLSGRNGLSVTMSNNASFAINGIFADTVAEWSMGDALTLAQTDTTYFPPFIMNDGGVPLIVPMYIILNTTNNTNAVGYLITPASPNPLLLQQIDIINGRITLSNATLWQIRPIDQRFFVHWAPTDLMFIAENLGTDRAVYDTILYNITRFETAHSFQDPP